MLKIKKKNNPQLNEVYAIELESTKYYTIAQLVYIFEVEGYYSLTFSFCDYLFEDLEKLKKDLSQLDLSKPFMVATIDVNPIKEWKLIGKNETKINSMDIKSNLSTSGWYMNREIGLYPKLECYFGIFPWDLVLGKTALNNIIFSGKPSKYARFMNEFSKEEATNLGIIGMIEYAGRTDELAE